jgi:hypothetical protein
MSQSKVVNIKQAPAGHPPDLHRSDLTRAIVESAKAREAVTAKAEALERADQHLRACEQRLEDAGHAVSEALARDASEAVDELRRGARVKGAGNVRAARMSESECLDEVAVAELARARLVEELAVLKAVAAEAGNKVYVARSNLIARLADKLLNRAEGLRRAVYIERCLLGALIEVVVAAPPVDPDVTEPMRLRHQAEREAPIADVKERINLFVLSREEDTAAGAAAAADMRGRLAKLLEDSTVALTADDLVKRGGE